jgi:hypothetical protein
LGQVIAPHGISEQAVMTDPMEALSRLLKKSETFYQSGDLIDVPGDKGGNGDARSR